MIILPKRLKQLRNENRLKQQNVADLYGVSVDYLIGRTDTP